MVWLALTVRKLLVVVAAVLAPFAFAGSLADFSRSWVRRWVEVVVALVFSKLILMFVFVTGLFVLLKGLGSTNTGGTQQITQTVSGVLILALAGFAPWVAIKMAHFAGAHLEGMHMMAGHASGRAQARSSRWSAPSGPHDARRYCGRSSCGRSVEHESLVTADIRQHVQRYGIPVGGRKVRPVQPRWRRGLIRNYSVGEQERPVV